MAPVSLVAFALGASESATWREAVLRSRAAGGGAMAGAGTAGETLAGAGAGGGAMAPADEDQAWERGPERGTPEVITGSGSSSTDPSDTVISGAGPGASAGSGSGSGAGLGSDRTAGTASAATWLDGTAVVTR